MKKVVPLPKAHETSLYGSKAVGLGDAARHGITVPRGVALSGDLVDAVASGEDKAIEQVAKAIATLPPPFVVRSSAVDEDGAAASFAGQHLTVVNVHSAADVPGAVREVWWSANSDSAITYRQRIGLFTRPSVGVVVQSLLNPTVAGVMFTEHPVTGVDERLIEASWGLGEAVVAGLVVPDHFRLDRSGQVLERKIGRKRIAIRCLPNGGTFEEQVPLAEVNRHCLDDVQLAALGELALQCEKVYGPRRDIEWAFQDGTLFLLQCRAITTSKGRGGTPPPVPPRRDPVAALRRVQLFADMDRRQAEQIARLLKERPFAKGETVIMEGSGGAAFFLIDSGEATVSSKGVDLATLGPGDYFGEIALIDGGPRSATVTAATDLVATGSPSGSSARWSKGTAQSDGSCCRYWRSGCARPTHELAADLPPVALESQKAVVDLAQDLLGDSGLDGECVPTPGQPRIHAFVHKAEISSSCRLAAAHVRPGHDPQGSSSNFRVFHRKRCLSVTLRSS